MKRGLLIAGCVLVLVALVGFDYQGYRLWKQLDEHITNLTQRVDETSKIAQEEGSAARAASQRADEAAVRAETAAGARRQAEEQKQLAEAGRAQAQTAAEQASVQAQQAAAQAQQAQDELSRIRKERTEELNRMQEALSHVVETRRTPQGMTIVLPDSTFRFDFDSADLSQKNRELLSRIAGILLVSKGYGLSVFGYTDDVGTAEYNQQLSTRRATVVQQYLVHAGLDPSIVNVKGYGKSSPLVAGSSQTARARNRRVEIALTDSEIRFVGEAPSASQSH